MKRKENYRIILTRKALAFCALGLVSLAFNPLNAAEQEKTTKKTGYHADITPADVNQQKAARLLRRNIRALRNMAFDQRIRFTDSYAREDFELAMDGLRRALGLLHSGGHDGDMENYRGRAVAKVHASLNPIWANQISKALPEYVSQGDFEFICAAVEKQPEAFLAGQVKSYFSKHSNTPKPRNYKGRCGVEVVQVAQGIFVDQALKELPEFVSRDDYAAVSSIIQNTPSFSIAQALRQYFNH